MLLLLNFLEIFRFLKIDEFFSAKLILAVIAWFQWELSNSTKTIFLPVHVSPFFFSSSSSELSLPEPMDTGKPPERATSKRYQSPPILNKEGLAKIIQALLIPAFGKTSAKRTIRNKKKQGASSSFSTVIIQRLSFHCMRFSFLCQ